MTSLIAASRLASGRSEHSKSNRNELTTTVIGGSLPRRRLSTATELFLIAMVRGVSPLLLLASSFAPSSKRHRTQLAWSFAAAQWRAV